MKEIYQTKFGKEGNCFSACLASILEIPLDKVPTYHEPVGEWFQNYRKWLWDFNLDLVAITNWDVASYNCPKVYAIVNGISPRGLHHSTVYFGLDIVHDPHPEGGGVKDITDWIYIISKEPRIL